MVDWSNPDEVSEYKKDYYLKKKDKIKEYKDEYYKENGGYVRKKAREYYNKNKTKIKIAKNELYHERRNAFFLNKLCKNCSSEKNLELHHRDPEKKGSSSIWFWRKDKREKEISKCDVLCRKCHVDTHKEDGRFSSRAILSKDDVTKIRKRLGDGETPIVISNDYPVIAEAIRNIRSGRTWSYLKE